MICSRPSVARIRPQNDFINPHQYFAGSVPRRLGYLRRFYRVELAFDFRSVSAANQVLAAANYFPFDGLKSATHSPLMQRPTPPLALNGSGVEQAVAVCVFEVVVAAPDAEL